MESQLQLQDPTDWCTLAYAAEKIGCSQRTVRRATIDGRLIAYRPRVGSRESGRRHLILYTEQVHAFATAYKLVNVSG
jgi:hypothetical protein